MEKRYSQMTEEELREEIADLKVKAQKAEQMGMVNEYAVHERKMTMAKAYMMDPNIIEQGATYVIEGSTGETFTVSYLNGVFAWGTREHSHEEEALPISLLGEKRS
ncbi:YfhH family protein [Bacillus shivajii]|uniref:YfhH family protein n=1 Tax=Bacillus shivajii TaxID=1983719 RepID=UPI001CFB6A5C|nr:YfhH family protein [Bacillus shivajii]UCZ54096.1 YfhH family protein [Bacillus shivajii]